MTDSALSNFSLKETLSIIWRLQFAFQNSKTKDNQQLLSELDALESYLLQLVEKTERLEKENIELRNRLSGLDVFMGVH